VRVLTVARKLAQTYHADMKEVELATVFHDYAKEMKVDSLKEYIKTHELDHTLLLYNKELWHGPVAAHIVQDDFKIENEHIFNAIYFHTTGRACMTIVELILFVADYIEPARTFPGVEE